jgi:hypothetical protein
MRNDALGPRLGMALLFACGGLGLHQAWAQANQEQPQPPSAAQDGASVGPPLSDKLNRSNGVITPPAATANTDPGIVKPTPDTGTTAMPVIPPPGTPGGNPNVQPK